jgi:hypothetical protein
MDEDKNIKKDGEMSLKEFFLILMKRKWWFIGSILIVLVIGLLYVFLKPANYQLTYQVEFKNNYTNSSLSMLYPSYEAELNSILPENIPVIFKSENGFESLNEISGDGIDYNQLRKSESVTIDLNPDTSVFNISVSSPNYNLADKAARILISALDDSIKDKEKNILNEVVGKIEQDINDLGDNNINYENTVLVDLENKLGVLYKDLYKYIIDYNTSLSDELEKNKKTENVSFYSLIIPPNSISYEISKLQEEAFFYNQKVLENNDKLVVLNNLKMNLINDESIIINRIEIISKNPIAKNLNNRLRDLIVVIILSILAGAGIVFVINYGFSLKKEKFPKK